MVSRFTKERNEKSKPSAEPNTVTARQDGSTRSDRSHYNACDAVIATVSAEQIAYAESKVFRYPVQLA